MKKIVSGLFVFILLIHFSVCAQDNGLGLLKGVWKILPEESEVTFRSRSFGLFPVTGTMKITSGSIYFSADPLERFSTSVELDPASLNTGNNRRDEHLRSEDFFYVEAYPVIRFTSDSLYKIGEDEFNYEINGDLLIRGVQQRETVSFNFAGYYMGKERIRFDGKTTVNRFDYNIDYRGLPSAAREARVTFSIVAEKTD